MLIVTFTMQVYEDDVIIMGITAPQNSLIKIEQLTFLSDAVNPRQIEIIVGDIQLRDG